jgi:hypothetical protein
VRSPWEAGETETESNVAIGDSNLLMMLICWVKKNEVTLQNNRKILSKSKEKHLFQVKLKVYNL